MCIGVPMQVVAVTDHNALCRDGDRTVTVDTALIGTPAVDDWLLIFLGTAREILDAATARAMRDAVAAVSRVMAGEHRIDHLFADLVDRDPPLPDHLQPHTKEA